MIALLDTQSYVVFDNVSIFPACVDIGAFFEYRGVGTYGIIQSKPTSEFGRRIIVSYDTRSLKFNERNDHHKVEVIGATSSFKEAFELYRN